MKNSKETTAIAHPNFALVKYWGKRDVTRNQPAMSSISITVDSMQSETTLTRNKLSNQHRLFINGKEESDLSRILPTIHYLSNCSKSDDYLMIKSKNNFPTSAGLASSASGIASFVTAYDAHYEMDLTMDDKVNACILGSGSSPRSLIGGFVIMDHRDNFKCSEILNKSDWPLDVLICIASTEPKKISSREGMEISRKTSPIYQNWLDINLEHINKASESIKVKDISELGKISEENCKLMHKVMSTSDPSIVYKSDITKSCLVVVEELRAKGHELFYTIDAGPQVKIICNPRSSEIIKDEILSKTRVKEIIHTKIGGPPSLINEN
mgnify:FL=1